MFNFFFSKVKKRQKKTEWALSICQKYSNSCVNILIKLAMAARAKEALDIHGGEFKDHLVSVSRFDPQISEPIGSDDSIHFWYAFGIRLAEEEGLGKDIGMVLAIRTLMEFLSLHSDEVADLGERRHAEGQKKLQKSQMG